MGVDVWSSGEDTSEILASYVRAPESFTTSGAGLQLPAPADPSGSMEPSRNWSPAPVGDDGFNLPHLWLL